MALRRLVALLATAAVTSTISTAAAGASLTNPPSNIAPNPDFTQVCASGQGVVDDTQPCLAAVLQAIDNARSQEGVAPLVVPTHLSTMPAEEQLLAVIDRERVDRGLPPFTGTVAELDQAAAQGASGAHDPSVAQPSYAGTGWSGTAAFSGGMPNALAADYFWMYEDGWGGSPATTINTDCTGPTSTGCWSHRQAILNRFMNLPNLTLGAAVDPSAWNGKPAWTLLMMGTEGQPSGYSFTWTSVLADSPGTGGGSPATCGVAGPPSTGKVGRLAGNDRDATAVAASQQLFPQPGAASAVVLASDANFPDALAGGPLAANKSAPLLITSPSGLAPGVEAEIKRVLPTGRTVYVLGGTLALPSSVDSALAADGYHVQRVFGPDRFATAVAIADVLGDPSTVLEATGLNFADALAAGPGAATSHAVILLTNGTQQASATATYLGAHPGTHYAIGGPAAAADPAATSIEGADRYETAVKVTQRFFPSPKMLGFATGETFPDALAGGPVLAHNSGGLLLVPKCPPLQSSVSGYLQSVSTSVTSGVLFGGTFAVSNETLDAVESALG